MTQSKKTAFHSQHQQAGAAMMDFGGWHMPVRYNGEKKEHAAVRERVGLFDVSHMGEIEVTGPNALPLLQYLTCNNVAKLKIGQTQYNVLMSEQGGFIDDLLIYRRGEQNYLLVVNAANQDKDFAHIEEHNKRHNASLRFASEDYVQLAIQGPKALEMLNPMCEAELAELRYFWFVETTLLGVEMIISRTGYTASDGFEIYFSPEHANLVWDKLIEAGKPFDMELCGLSARDSLRIEGKMVLHGSDVTESTSPLEANLKWVVKLDKGPFIGKQVLEQQDKEGVDRLWVGFQLNQRGIPRHGYPVWVDGKQVGEVTSGTLSPSLGKGIGMTYLPLAYCKEGQEISIEIRGCQIPAEICPTPFYKVNR